MWNTAATRVARCTVSCATNKRQFSASASHCMRRFSDTKSNLASESVSRSHNFTRNNRHNNGPFTQRNPKEYVNKRLRNEKKEEFNDLDDADNDAKEKSNSKVYEDSFLLRQRIKSLLENGSTGDSRCAERALEELRASKVGAKHAAAWDPLLHYYASLGCSVRAKNIFNEMKERGAKPTAHSFSALMRAYANSTAETNRKNADLLLQSIPPEHKSLYLYNYYAQVLARNRDWDVVVKEVLSNPERPPSTATITVILKHLSAHAREVSTSARSSAEKGFENIYRVLRFIVARLLRPKITDSKTKDKSEDSCKLVVDARLIGGLCSVCKFLECARHAGLALHIYAGCQGPYYHAWKEVNLPPVPEALAAFVADTETGLLRVSELNAPELRGTDGNNYLLRNWLMEVAHKVDRINAAEAKPADGLDKTFPDRARLMKKLLKEATGASITDTLVARFARVEPNDMLLVEHVYRQFQSKKSIYKNSETIDDSFGCELLFSGLAQSRRPMRLLLTYMFNKHGGQTVKNLWPGVDDDFLKTLLRVPTEKVNLNALVSVMHALSDCAYEWTGMKMRALQSECKDPVKLLSEACEQGPSSALAMILNSDWHEVRNTVKFNPKSGSRAEVTRPLRPAVSVNELRGLLRISQSWMVMDELYCSKVRAQKLSKTLLNAPNRIPLWRTFASLGMFDFDTPDEDVFKCLQGTPGAAPIYRRFLGLLDRLSSAFSIATQTLKQPESDSLVAELRLLERRRAYLVKKVR